MSTPYPNEVVTLDIAGCARCHGDGHDELAFEPLTNPHECCDGAVMTHWASCPVNGEPILLGTVNHDS